MNLLEKTEQAFHQARVSTIEAAGLLYECHETGEWRSGYDTWHEFLTAIDLTPSGATRLLTIHLHYKIEGKISPAKMAQVGVEKLYLATSLTGTPKEQFIKAETLSKTEIKAQRVYEETGEECAHEETYTICKNCHTRLS